jgi:hypothetical protein
MFVTFNCYKRNITNGRPDGIRRSAAAVFREGYRGLRRGLYREHRHAEDMRQAEVGMGDVEEHTVDPR